MSGTSSTSFTIFLSLFLLMLLFSTSSTTADQIQRKYISLGSSLTAQLNQNESWQSPSGDFAFGFRQIQNDGFLLAIWFNKIPEKTIVWSANRDNPVQQGSTVQLTKRGSLVLRDSTGKQAWSPAVSGIAHAAMLDTGNFVLTNQSLVNFWESFDEPTDTLLPTQILGQGKGLVSCRSEKNYSSGRFHLTVENGFARFYAISFPQPNLRVDYLGFDQGNVSQIRFNQSGPIYLESQNGTILRELLTPSSSSNSEGFYHRAVLDYHGVFRHYAYPKEDDGPNSSGRPRMEWSQVSRAIPEKMCSTMNTDSGPGACGYNSLCSQGDDGRPRCDCLQGYSLIDSKDEMRGCKPNFEAQSCDEDSEDANQFTMFTIENSDWPNCDSAAYFSKSEEWCENACLVDCFCALAVYVDNKCYIKNNPLSNGRQDPSLNMKALYKVRKVNSSSSKPSESIVSKRKDLTTQIVIGSVLVSSSVFLNILLLTTTLVFFFCLRRNASATKPNQTMLETNLQNFTFAELEKATNGFEEQLGIGAFGVVYKGFVETDNNITSIIAVKKLDNNNMVKEGEQEFKTEVMSIGRTNHKNLVRLIGFCNQGEHRLLVFEYMSNGSLASFLFGPLKPTWHQRKQIALGIARGLFYLHEECNAQIIHCDIKPQNILLDDSYTARISDFGLAKILKTDQTRTTTGIRGTKGYVAPEWFRNLAVTAKVDVYSYGILLLELICCRKNVEENVEDDAQMILADWACDCYESGKVKCLVENDDEALEEMKMVEKYVMVALWCIQEDPSLRPTMKKVMLMLEGSVKVSAPPLPNSFISSL